MELLDKQNRRKAFREGFKDAIPIGLGYFAVAFSLGISAQKAGLSAIQGFIASCLCVSSTGEYAGFMQIGARAALAEVALMTFIINMRYMLMSLALSQKTSPKTPFFHRLIFGAAVTDELFAINIARPGYLEPFYYYGAMTVSIPLWALGTSIGIVAGDVLPARVVSALSVALYGMFLAIIVPPARKNKVIAGLIVICFAASYAAEKLSFLASLSSGTKTMILTIVIASAAALLFPRPAEPKPGRESNPASESKVEDLSSGNQGKDPSAGNKKEARDA